MRQGHETLKRCTCGRGYPEPGFEHAEPCPVRACTPPPAA
jgi:hypothetical protein